MTQNDNGFKSFLASTTLGAFTAVDVDSSGKIAASAVSTRPVGILQEDVASGNFGSVKLLTASGTFMIALGAAIVTAGTNYSLMASGLMGGTVGTALVFKALSSQVTASGTVIEFAYTGGSGPS